MRNLVAVLVGKAVVRASRALGHGGSSLPGLVALRIQPSLLRHLSGGLARGAVVITGTNGKTTTASLLGTILAGAGFTLVRNRAGANLVSGLASALLEASRGGPVKADYALLEVDEATVPEAVRQVEPVGLVVTNFFRDQLDRYGELDTTVSYVRRGIEAMRGRGFVALNADDPLVASLGPASRDRVVYYGIEDPASGTPTTAQTREQRHCLACGRPLAYDVFYYGHLGRYRCPAGDFGRPEPHLQARAVSPSPGRGSSFVLTARGEGEIPVKMPVPGLYNVYNGLAALAAAVELGVPLPTAAEAVGRAAPSFGRMERIDVRGREVLLALVKNPTGFNQVLRTILESEPRQDEAGRFFLLAINDRHADGTDVSWLWDVDFETLAEPGARATRFVTSGLRAHDMAVRLKYAGVPEKAIIARPELAEALDLALDSVGEGRTLFVTPTYTAMLELRDIISRRGYAPQFWEVGDR